MMQNTHLFTKKKRTRRNCKFDEGDIRPFFLAREEIKQPQQLIEAPLWRNDLSQSDDNGKFNDHQSFCQAIKPILTVTRILGILPECRNSSRTSKKSIYRFISLRTLYSVIIIILMTIRTCIAIFRAIETSMASSEFGTQGGVLNILREITFYLNGTVAMMIFLWISPKWMDLQSDWKATEERLSSGYEHRPQYRRKFYTILSFVMIPAFAEHVISISNNISAPRLVTDSSNGLFDDYMRAYLLKAFPPSFHIFIAGAIMFILQEFAVIIWNYTDIFIMLVSTGLAENYKSLNEAAFLSVKKNRLSFDWPQLREKYAILSILVKKADSCISPLVLLSFAVNIYVICLQLYNGLAVARTGSTETIYFFGSFSLLLGRTMAVTLLAARINDQSKMFLPEIYSCPTSCFTIESERLQRQLTSDDVALSGMKFFFVTRQFLMTVASVIVTYEVVLLQSNKAH